MNHPLLPLGLTLLLHAALSVQGADSAPPPRASPDSVQVTRVDQDRPRVDVSWTRVDEQGQEVVETSGYWELGGGLNYWDEATSSWETSVEEIVLAEQGAVAVRGPHRVIFAPTLDDPEGAVDLVAPDGQRFQSSVLALGYFDPLSGQRALLNNRKILNL